MHTAACYNDDLSLPSVSVPRVTYFKWDPNSCFLTAAPPRECCDLLMKIAHTGRCGVQGPRLPRDYTLPAWKMPLPDGAALGEMLGLMADE